ncbi:MAG: serine--tRNA ligase [Chitinophagaceae bacterium]|nr:serine--tRNA ligase [Chitinophagaceae bacterium]MCW5914599.1 serine--tRNA ligase [Chitinophagaceae bacterium]MCZ2395295.1 serine--tRNA ligase [Chitinophagales bacterium]
MLQIPYIRQNKEEVLKRLAKKHFQAGEIVEKLLQADDLRKKLLFEKEEAQSKINNASRQIKELMSSGQKEKAEEVKAEVLKLKNSMAPVSDQLAAAEKEADELLVLLPNLPHDSVPEGRTPEDNVVVREGGVKPDLYEGAQSHWDLAKKFDLIDFEAGNKVTGSGFPFYKGRGAKLQRALIQYFLDYNTEAGYLEYEAPLMVNEASAYGTGQLPDKEGQMYHVQIDNFYLIPTAEVPLTNLYRGEIIDLEKLPVKLTGYTPCFRREAGSYGKDVRGLNRLHQFDKVEIVQICEPGSSYEALEGMVAHVEKLLASLELPYRILRLCGGDMSFTSALTYDFEVYSAAQKRWLEVSSVSNFESFQANRAKIRYKDAEGKNHLAHTLNGSSLALPRIVAALLENHQTEVNIRIPDSLRPYFGSSWIV